MMTERSCDDSSDSDSELLSEEVDRTSDILGDEETVEDSKSSVILPSFLFELKNYPPPPLLSSVDKSFSVAQDKFGVCGGREKEKKKKERNFFKCEY
jgi:hypothetical protein